MKYIFFTIAIFYAAHSFSQTITPLENSSTFSDNISHMKQIGNTLYYFFGEATHNIQADSVLKYDIYACKLNLQTMQKKKVKLDLDTNSIFGFEYNFEQEQDSLSILLQNIKVCFDVCNDFDYYFKLYLLHRNNTYTSLACK